ncbi:uncharacterized protein LOC131989986 isoform X2 [Centropristis striata]|uniref:uncharacterized protein LOC131989986 isoform X2 n=1 Tax=Centropristis striata TaxID=184440 RepID=UPI0027E20354|nr:uncharacterized protein LOC131989986 isoform X2 [Centropristis striata]
MPTQKKCPTCQASIGVASKVCKHCGARQPYKKKLEQAKEKISLQWKETQKKNKSVNKVYDATNLVLHKWNQLDRHPILLLAKRTGKGFVAECLCPQPMPTQGARDALLTIQRIYESILNVALTKETEAEETLRNETEEIRKNETEEIQNIETEEILKTETEEIQTAESEQTLKTEPEDASAADTLLLPSAILPFVVPGPASGPMSVSRSELSPLSDSVISFIVTPVSASLPSTLSTSMAPVSTSLPSTVSTSLAPGSASLPSTLSAYLPSTLSASVLSTLSTSLAPALKGRNKNKRKAYQNECPVHHGSTTFPYERILRERVREGHAEVFVRWSPCSGCGAKWEDTWEPKENFK